MKWLILSTMVLFNVLTLNANVHFGDSLRDVLEDAVNTQQRLEKIETLIQYFKNENLDSALIYCDLYEREVVMSQNDLNLAKSKALYASVYNLKGESGKLVEYAYPAIKLYKEIGNIEGQVKMYNLLGRMYASISDFDAAYGVYEEGKSLAQESDDPLLIVSINIGISNAKFLEQKGEESEQYLYECLEIFKQHTIADSAEYLAKIYTNLGNANSWKENDLKAIEYYKKSYSFYKETGDKFGESLTAFNIGDTYNYMGVYDSSEKYFNITIGLGEELNSYEELYYGYLGLTELFEHKGELLKALENQKLKYAYKDSLLQLKYDESVIELEQKYLNQKQADELKAAQIEILKSEEEKKRDWIIILSLMIGTAVMVLATIGLYYFYLKVRKANQVIKAQSIRIDKDRSSLDRALKQKETLLKEVHHRVKNNLQIIASLLNLQSNKINNQAAKKAIEESKSRVQAIALMHKGLYQSDNFDRVELSQYVNELIDVQKSLSYVNHQEVMFDLELEKIELTVDDAVPIGLIISELISNSIKHAFKEDNLDPKISIAINNYSGKVKLSYSDNGVGLPADFNIETQESLGFEVITALTEQVGGNINVISHLPLQIDIEF